MLRGQGGLIWHCGKAFQSDPIAPPCRPVTSPCRRATNLVSDGSGREAEALAPVKNMHAIDVAYARACITLCAQVEVDISQIGPVEKFAHSI
jgi:hypothetical protein